MLANKKQDHTVSHFEWLSGVVMGLLVFSSVLCVCGGTYWCSGRSVIDVLVRELNLPLAM